MLIFSALIIACSVGFLLNVYARKKTGIRDAIFYFTCRENAWVAETAWLNNLTGEVNKIITTSNWQDGVVSVLTNGDTIYHTKQPHNDREGLQRFHKIARQRFFIQLKWKTILESKMRTNLALTTRS